MVFVGNLNSDRIAVCIPMQPLSFIYILIRREAAYSLCSRVQLLWLGSLNLTEWSVLMVKSVVSMLYPFMTHSKTSGWWTVPSFMKYMVSSYTMTAWST